MFMDEGCGPQFQTTYDHDRAYRNPHITDEPVPGTGSTPTIMTTVSADNMLVKPHLSPTKERPMKEIRRLAQGQKAVLARARGDGQAQVPAATNDGAALRTRP